jgi:glycosyltransferase involved in cell wall biosynthesis
VKYKNIFPKYKELNWISMSYAQRQGMPEDTNWIANIPHGISTDTFKPSYSPSGGYIAYVGRIIEAKGVHLAIAAVKEYNKAAKKPLKLKIAGKHYAGHTKDTYWQQRVEPLIDGSEIEYVGFINDAAEKQAFIGNAHSLIIPSIFDEPFGMVMIEALACGTPLIGLDSGAIPEVIEDGKTGTIVSKKYNDQTELNEEVTVSDLALAISRSMSLDRHTCREAFESKYTLQHMATAHKNTYERLIK